MAIIGPSALILPFQALGLELMAAETPADARKWLRGLESGMDEGVAFITDELALLCRDEISDLRRKPRVAVLPVPDPALGERAGTAHHEHIRELVRRAVGMDLLGEQRR